MARSEHTDKADENGEQNPTRNPSLLRNYTSFIGLAIAAAGLTSFLLLVLMELSGTADNPYTALVTYIFVPSVLAFGLILTLTGALFERRRRRRMPDAELTAFPVLDFNDRHRRRRALAVLFVAFIFLFMSAFGSYRAYEYTESVAFCGQACHSVMKPEFVAYNASPHARVACVECHVGGGPEWYVKSKFAGMRQLWAVTFHSYDTPIHTPVANLRPANDTCAKCHWPEKFHGDVIRVFDHYNYDETSSLDRTRLLVKVGGGSVKGGPVGGIHWHMNVANEITYVPADAQRQIIPWVRMKDSDGVVTEYTAKDTKLSPQQVRDGEHRKMDCIDCHNRPTHIFLTPNNAVDQSISSGKLDISLPFMKAKAVEALNRPYATEDEAVGAIAAFLDEYYRTNYANLYNDKHDSITGAIAEVQRLYRTYFFPEMKTDWSSHANNVGHLNSQGCFRCHDGQHFSPEGKVIRNECNVCHTTIDQTFDGKTIVPPEGKFRHPVDLGDRGNWLCSTCHKADRPFKHPLNLGDISRFQCADCHSGTYQKVPLPVQ